MSSQAARTNSLMTKTKRVSLLCAAQGEENNNAAFTSRIFIMCNFLHFIMTQLPLFQKYTTAQLFNCTQHCEKETPSTSLCSGERIWSPVHQTSHCSIFRCGEILKRSHFKRRPPDKRSSLALVVLLLDALLSLLDALLQGC